ncbi:hypothetical protein [Nostoc sp. NOS(2021)]|nr:hypothetical protein [Nostoc sp. NOS(2021)]
MFKKYWANIIRYYTNSRRPTAKGLEIKGFVCVVTTSSRQGK